MTLYVFSVGMLISETTYGNDYNHFRTCFVLAAVLTFLLIFHEMKQMLTQRIHKGRRRALWKRLMRHFSRKENAIEFGSILFTLIYLGSALFHYWIPMQPSQKLLNEMKNDTQININNTNLAISQFKNSTTFISMFEEHFANEPDGKILTEQLKIIQMYQNDSLNGMFW